MSSWLNLENKVCIVTGAASGIGAQIAKSLAAAGARVGLVDQDLAGAQQVVTEILASRGVAVAVQCDVADESSVLVAKTKLEQTLGQAYGLVNNAGFLRSSPLADVSLEQWNSVLAVNLTGYLLVARSFASQLRASSGSIVNVASIAANFPQTFSGAYSASKAGVVQMSRQMAVEWGRKGELAGIRCNVICPGMIRTALSAKFYEIEGVESKRAAMTASGRIGEPIDIANAALFLLSPVSSYVNAVELSVDGGMPAMLMDMVPRPGYNM